MANSSSTATVAANKSHPHSIPHDTPPVIGGLVQHALVSASMQVKILSIIDETGSATVGDIAEQLPDHPDPVGAIVVMINLRILVADVRGVLDANTIVRRATPEPDPAGAVVGPPDIPPVRRSAATVCKDDDPTAGLERLEVSPFSVNLIVGPGSQRRDFARLEELRRPGIYGLVSASSVYIGMGGDVGQRIAGGQQPIQNIDKIFVMTDANGHLTTDDARVAERNLWSRTTAFGDRALVNGVPDGGPVSAQRYSELDLFVAEGCLALLHHDLLFTGGSVRNLLAGPRGEPGRVGPLRPLNDVPEGEIFELGFGNGLVALAARQTDDRWLLLRGSEVRIDTVPTASASASFQRSAWLHSGLLGAGADGKSYVVTRDLVFPSGSAVALFCTGAKGRGLAGWQSIDADGGYDPATPALIVG